MADPTGREMDRLSEQALVSLGQADRTALVESLNRVRRNLLRVTKPSDLG